MTNGVDAIDAIDLTTYEGEDPYLIHEPACQKCHAKQSEAELTKCSGCSVVWYCSDECMEVDTVRHGRYCRNYVSVKASIDNKVQELREQHNIEDPYVPIKCLGCSKGWSARGTHGKLYGNMKSMSSYLHGMAYWGETTELWEIVLDSHLKAFRMRNRRSWMDDDTASNIAFTLIRLDRLEDAWRFIRSTMVKYTHGERTVIEYEPQDRYSDCLNWVRSFYNVTWSFNEMQGYIRKDNMHNMILSLIIIKLRIRAAAARNTWKDTIDEVFLKTNHGRELVPVKFILEEYFSLSDDAFQLEQIRLLMSIIHGSYSPFLLFLEHENSLLQYGVNSKASTCLRRTPQGHQLMLEELNSDSFVDRCTKLRAVARLAKQMENKKKWSMIAGGFFTIMVSLARLVLILRQGLAARRFGYFTIFFVSFFTWCYLLDGVSLSAAGAIVGLERCWGERLRKAMGTLATTSTILLLYFCGWKTAETHFFQKGNNGMTIADWFYAFVDDWLLNEIILVSVINIVLWWKVVPTPSSMDAKKGTKVIISAFLLTSLVCTYVF